MTSRIDKLVREVGGLERLAGATELRRQPVTLVVDAGTPVVLLRTAVALSLRCFAERVHIKTRGAGLSALGDAAACEAVEYGAEDRLSVGTSADGLSLGLSCTEGSDLYVDARGDMAGINTMLPGGAPSSAAASFAASAGVAKLLVKAIAGQSDAVREQWSFSLGTLDVAGDQALPDGVDVGRVLVIGAGAIGSGFAHVLRHSQWRGHIEIVDREVYDEPNHETTLLISQQDARDCRKKAETLAGLLQRPELTAHGGKEEIVSASPILAAQWDAVVVAVDNPDLRRALDNVQSVILNAGVGGARDDAGHVLFSRHRPTDPALSSLYRAGSNKRAVTDAPKDIEDECSRIAYADVALAAPFLGLAAGALLAASVGHLASGIETGTNYLKFDLLGQQRFFVRESRVRR